jgi:hypothetical protein
LSGLVVPLLCACGHLGFDDLSTSDAANPDSMTDAGAPMIDAAPPIAIACGSLPRFTVAATGPLMRLAAAGTASGYRVFTSDNAGQVRGSVFEFAAGSATLAQTGSETPIAANATGPLTASDGADGILLAMPYGRPNATGTALIPLDAALAARGAAAMNDGWDGEDGSLAQSTGGALALLLQNVGTHEVDAQLISSLGVASGAASPVVDSSDNPQNEQIVPVGTGYLVAWDVNSTVPNEVHAILLDSDLRPTMPSPLTVSFDKMLDSFAPSVAYLAGADRYLFVWTQKRADGGDQAWMSLRDGSLTELVPPVDLTGANQGVTPQVIASDHDFVVAWDDGTGHLAATRVAPGGVLTPAAVSTTGGTALAWNLVAREGQAALVWLEAGGSGPNLWIDPLCE